MNKGIHKVWEIEITAENKVYENRFCEFFDDYVIFPSGANGKFLRLRMKGCYSVAVLPITKEGEMVFIKTFRHSARGWGLRFPKVMVQKKNCLLIVQKESWKKKLV